jgi:hypothetical protein
VAIQIVVLQWRNIVTQMAETVRVEIEGAAPVSGLLQMPADARAC